MVADEPDFESYTEAWRQLAREVPQQVGRKFVSGASRLLVLLGHRPVADRVHGAVRRGQWGFGQMGDGEVDGPVALSGGDIEREPLGDPLLVAFPAEGLEPELEHFAGDDDVLVGDLDDTLGEVSDRRGVAGYADHRDDGTRLR